MPTKKVSSKTSSHDKTLIEKIGEQAVHLKEEIIAGKDHLVEAAENKIAAVKETIKKYQARRKKAAKKVAKKAVRKVVKKSLKKVVKKVRATTPAKKSTKKRK